MPALRAHQVASERALRECACGSEVRSLAINPAPPLISESPRRRDLQFTRTIQNYQKAYRKKVEGLKTELKTTRTANAKLTKQVKGLRRWTRFHVPSMAVGMAVGAAAFHLYNVLIKNRRAKRAAAAAEEEEEEEVIPQGGRTPPQAEVAPVAPASP